MTNLILLFRHCIERGEERPYIDRLIADAQKRFKGLYMKDAMWWETKEEFHFKYLIPPASIVVAARQFAIPVSEMLIARLVPNGVDVCGKMFLLPQRVRLEVEHTSLRRPLDLIARPLIKGRTKAEIVQMARALKLEVTAE